MLPPTSPPAIPSPSHTIHCLPACAAPHLFAAKRVLGNINVVYVLSGQAARRLGVSHRTLGRMTGNVWLQAGEERRDRVDVGLCVKNGAKAVYVPDFARPNMEGGEAKGACSCTAAADCWLPAVTAAVCLQHIGPAACQHAESSSSCPSFSHSPELLSIVSFQPLLLLPRLPLAVLLQAGPTASPSFECWTTTAAASPGCGPPLRRTRRQVGGGRPRQLPLPANLKPRLAALG